MFCQKCGNEIADDGEFCPKCGNKVKSEKTSDENKEVEKSNGLEAGEKKSNKTVTIVVVALIAVAVIGILIKCLGGMLGSSILSSYKIATDVEVVATTVNDNEGYFAVKNTGDQVIRDFTLTVVGYDASGNVVALNGQTLYKSFDFTTANIMPDSVYGLGRSLYLNSTVKYIDAMVSQITYKDGSTWSTEGLDAWAKDISDEFSVESYKQYIEGLKTEAVLAESNPYIEITGTSKYNDNRFSTQDDFDLSAKNIGDQMIQKFDVIVLEYDGNGYAVRVSPYEFATQNSRVATVDPANIDSGSEEGWNWSLFFQAECNSYKTIVYSIEFKDGTTWINENALPWMLYNEDRR